MFKIPVFLFVCFTLFTQGLFGQEPMKIAISSDPHWERLYDLRIQGLAQDEIKFLDSIIEVSIQKENAVDLFIALHEYNKSISNSLLEKDQKHETLESFEKLAIESKSPFSNILHAFLAQQYMRFEYAWDIIEWRGDYAIKSILNGKEVLYTNTDMDLRNEIIENHYRLSLSNNSLLEKLETKDFRKDESELYYAQYPSLVDYYAISYISFLQSNKNMQYSQMDSKQVSAMFGNSDKSVLAADDEVLQVYSLMESMNWRNKRVYAYVNWRLDRMAYVYRQLSLLKDDVRIDAYLKAIVNMKSEIQETFKDHPAILAVILRESEILASDARNQYHWKTNPAAKDQKRKVHDIISQGIQDYPKSLYADIAKSKLMGLESKKMTVNYENQKTTDKAGLLTVDYQNVSKAYLTVFYVEGYREGEYPYNRLKELRLTSIHEQELSLETNGAFNLHTKDFLIPAWRKTGKYLIGIAETKESLNELISTDSLFSNTSFAYAEVDVSKMVVSTNIAQDLLTFLIQNNETGSPIAGALIYDNGNQGNRSRTRTRLLGKTDSRGIFKTNIDQAMNWSMNWMVVDRKDSVVGHAYHYNRNSSNQTQEVKTKIITDRAIYRPGQKVYYKLYAYEGDSPNFKVVNGYKTTVYIEDDNGTEFGEVDIVTNEFGTYSGSFDLPRKGFLPGTFVISDYNDNSDQYSETQFLVEEYKRPTFEVKSDFDKKVYQLEEEVTVSGDVKAFSGFGLKDVKLHVVVEAIPSGWRSYNSSRTNVLDTTIQTTDQGAFSFAFIAKSDGSKYGSNFSYTISATSLAGETQTFSNSIFIGKSKSEWSLLFPKEVLSSAQATGKVILLNADSSERAKTVTLEVWKSNPKSKPVFHFFEPKEFHDFTAAAFKKEFVYSYYGAEKDYLNYEKVKTISVLAGDSINIHALTNREAGSYQVRLAGIIDELKDDEKQQINENLLVSDFNYIDAKSKKNQHNGKLWVISDVEYSKVGNEVSFLIGSSFKKLNARIEMYRGSKLIAQTTKKIKGRTSITYTIRKEDLGGITLYVRAVSSGEVLTAQSSVKVLFQELKGLDIQLQTERSILRPGESEIWKLKVSSNNGSPLTAEGVATLTDASLRTFGQNEWDFDIYKSNYFSNTWKDSRARSSVYFKIGDSWNQRYFNNETIYRGSRSDEMHYYIDGIKVRGSSFTSNSSLEEVQVSAYKMPLINKDGGASFSIDSESSDEIELETIKTEKVRTNMNETAFFYPTLYSADNEYQIEFTLPDALTSWDFQAMFHDKGMRYGTYKKNFVAQKELMIQPNAPRFFRAGDEVEFAANAINLTDEAQDVTVSLEWFDPFTNEVLPNVFGILESHTLKLEAQENQAVFWKLNIPKSGVDLIAYRIRVASAEFSDAEEKAIPVLSNRTQIIESVPVTIESAGNYTYDLTKLTKPTSNTQINQSLVLEYNSNPIWSVVMAVPYVMDQTTESADQIFNTYFINQLSQQIIEKNPAIETVLSLAGNSNPDLFLSTLDKNPELKDIILAETPWLLDSKSESMQRKRISSLFNTNNLETQEDQLLTRLELLKNSDGGWSWFGNGTSNVYTTQYILAGFGHLKSTGIKYEFYGQSMDFLDKHYAEQFAKLNKEQRAQFRSISSMEIQWLYIRSMFDMKATEVSSYYTESLKKEWTKQTLQVQAMAGIYFANVGEDVLADKILKSILNRKTTKQNLGTFWNENSNGYSWDRNAIETQAALINFFTRMEVDKTTINSMKMWLLNQKRGQAWESSKATSLACYAMLTGDSPVSATSIVPTIQLGDERIDASAAAKNLGYLKQTWTGKEIEPSMGKLSITQTVDEPAFGSLSLTYTEEINKIQKNNTGIGIDKKMYLIQDGKEVLITPTTILQLGDLIRVRLQVENDQTLEFVHIKDTKASGSENVETLSGHKSAGNIYYYQVVHDASTDFFLDNLPRGKHHLTYDLRISGKGVQSTGYASVECMYSPEFRANSSSTLIQVK